MLYKMQEWESNGKWHCGCVDHLGTNSGSWVHPARILKLMPADYIKWVIDNFHPEVWHNKDCSFVCFSWTSQADERKYKNKINAEARKINYQI